MSLDLRLDRHRLRDLAFLAAVALLVAAVALRSLGSAGADPGAAPTPESGPSASPAVEQIDLETFCTTYAGLAEAYGAALETGGSSDSLAALEAAGETLRTVGQPPTMGPVEAAGRDLFIADTLAGFGVERPEPDDPALASQQLSAFSGWLTTSCPGY